MAGASDPLEDMLFNEVDEKAVSDLVGSLESQLGDRKPPAPPFSAGKRDAAPSAAGHFSGKVRGAESAEQPQQGHPGAVLTPEPAASEPPSAAPLPSSTSAGPAGASLAAVGPPPPAGSPGPGPLGAPAAGASFPRAAVPGPSAAEAVRSSPPGLQSVNGGTGAAKLVSSPGVPATAGAGPATSQPGFPVPQHSGGSPSAVLQRLPSPAAQNGLDPQGGPPAAPAASASQVVNHNNPLMHAKVLVPSQPATGSSVILTGTPSPVQAPISHPQTGTSTSPSPGAKPAVNGVSQPAVAVVRPPGPAVVATSIPQQRPGLVAATTRVATSQPSLAVRPQQQTTIQLPQGFTMPQGMVLVRTETGQLVMVPQQVLAQAQAKTQQSQAVTSITQRPATPTAATTIRKALAVAPSITPVSVKMTTPQKTPTVITTGGTPVAKPAGVPSTPMTGTPAPAASPATRVTVVSQEMQENVKKCKNFLATLIKLASHNSPSPDTSKNVKALVQDLLDAKIEPEEFTTRLQAELKSSPQPYLIPFLKKSLPALRQTLLNSQQSLMTAPPGAVVTPPATPGSVTAATIRPRLPVNPAGGTVRLNAPIGTAALPVCRPGVQTVQARAPIVFRPQATLQVRGPTTIISKSPVNLAAQANQKKLSDPGGGTFRDDDDINDVASMAGVNLNEENARILATSSELVGTKIRSCKDEAFLPSGLLLRRILDTAKKFGVSEVPPEVVNLVSHATQSRLRTLLEKVSAIAQHRTDGGKDEERYEQTSDVRSQLRFFEQLERLEKQRKDEQEREMLLKAAKSRARQEDPEQARLKQKAKEMQQQELAQMRQRDANLTALAAIGPRKKRKLDSPGGAGTEVSSGSAAGSSVAGSSRQQPRQRITRVNLRDLIFCMEHDRPTARSLILYKALLK
ncbi:transcription initiation factor TFIID subunit 4-like isoform X4 [Astatotilapia calliptera]|uniref:transcription initiation factor TFIID subunit 4-like isoform X4 n=1 Tax=Astatotilapia calliptera TaxID=8154 RepID=UPI000E40B566|nr:transcription initiation factor TFIID subunit 4-like isoform X4 [Astatotilapia calliptera]